MKDPIARREENNKKLKAAGIICFDDLPPIESSAEIAPRSFDAICRRAVAALLSIQVALDAHNGDWSESINFFSDLFDRFGVRGDVLPLEEKVLSGKSIEQDEMNVAWTYEAYWSLVWVLGLVEDMSPDNICDGETAVRLVSECRSMEEFQSKCRLRDIEEILDMLDLYYRCHWAAVEKRLRPERQGTAPNEEIVYERRRGLEWLCGGEDDWFDISLDT